LPSSLEAYFNPGEANFNPGEFYFNPGELSLAVLLPPNEAKLSRYGVVPTVEFFYCKSNNDMFLFY